MRWSGAGGRRAARTSGPADEVQPAVTGLDSLVDEHLDGDGLPMASATSVTWTASAAASRSPITAMR